MAGQRYTKHVTKLQSSRLKHRRCRLAAKLYEKNCFNSGPVGVRTLAHDGFAGKCRAREASSPGQTPSETGEEARSRAETSPQGQRVVGVRSKGDFGEPEGFWLVQATAMGFN